MSDFKFACPACGQHIAGDERWAGTQIKCPVCQAEMMVPQTEAAKAPAMALTPPVPPAGSPIRLSITPGPTAHASPPAPAPSVPAAPAGPRLPVSRPLQTERKPGMARAVITTAIVVVVLAVVVILALPLINRAQDKMNEARKKEVEESGGGQVGHLAELNSVLDATDPARFERGRGAKEKPKKQLPAVTWSLEADAGTIPSGQVRGKITGAYFELEDAVIEVTGPAYVLTLRQGLPPLEMLVSLRLKPGENIQGKSWTVSREMTSGAPGVVKRSYKDDVSPPRREAFAGGYAMKLEFGKATAGVIEGKIYLALPDAEQSVVAGEFRADIRVAGSAGGKPARPGMSSFGE